MSTNDVADHKADKHSVFVAVLVRCSKKELKLLYVSNNKPKLIDKLNEQFGIGLSPQRHVDGGLLCYVVRDAECCYEQYECKPHLVEKYMLECQDAPCACFFCQNCSWIIVCEHHVDDPDCFDVNKMLLSCGQP